MLTIRRVNRYRSARYPAGRWVKCEPRLPESLVRRGAASLFALAVLETLSCDNRNGVVGPPPLPPELVTENEARLVIEQVFEDNGIPMERDVLLMLRLAGGDSVGIELDGFNDSLRVGYEYISYPEDRGEFNWHVRETLDSLFSEDGPYIKGIDTWGKYDGFESILRLEIEAFIDTLKSHGII
ncbi:MAG: hypothetical protein HY770_05775 [Chitinivibrionia bacterium]|nr:hypothetical protein [Chitinivibrionia bacterium]